MRTPRLPAVDWTEPSADLNGLVRFAERPNLVFARVPSRFKRAIQYFCIISLFVASLNSVLQIQTRTSFDILLSAALQRTLW